MKCASVARNVSCIQLFHYIAVLFPLCFVVLCLLLYTHKNNLNTYRDINELFSSDNIHYLQEIRRLKCQLKRKSLVAYAGVDDGFIEKLKGASKNEFLETQIPNLRIMSSLE